MVTEPVTLYVDAGLLADDRDDALLTASKLGFATVVVEDRSTLPQTLAGAWHLSTDIPEAGSPRWSRTIVVGPRAEPGRRAVTGLRTARDLRLAVLELASEQALG
jgi:hypothetical protein